MTEEAKLGPSEVKRAEIFQLRFQKSRSIFGQLATQK